MVTILTATGVSGSKDAFVQTMHCFFAFFVVLMKRGGMYLLEERSVCLWNREISLLRRFSNIESLILVGLYDFPHKRSSFESEPSCFVRFILQTSAV